MLRVNVPSPVEVLEAQQRWRDQSVVQCDRHADVGLGGDLEITPGPDGIQPLVLPKCEGTRTDQEGRDSHPLASRGLLQSLDIADGRVHLDLGRHVEMRSVALAFDHPVGDRPAHG